MNYEELAFANHQLAGMLRSGLPLEGALKQLCASMKRGKLRGELEQLEAELARGTPLEKALAARQLPEFYRAMLRLGTHSQDLPAVLTLLADYYQRAHQLWTRLKGLLLYPVIVLVASLALSVGLALIFSTLAFGDAGVFTELNPAWASRGWEWTMLSVCLWAPAILFALVLGFLLAAMFVPALRERLRWKMPGFREASLSQFASTFALLLSQGCQVRETVTLLHQLESGRLAGAELQRWRERLAEGQQKFHDLAAGGRVFPPLFVWLVASAGEDWVAGLRRAAEIYYNRAVYRIEVMLYAVLPVSVLVLGIVIVCQVMPALRTMLGFFSYLTDFGEF